MASTSSFPFLSLSLEIRVMIYRYLMSEKMVGSMVHISKELFHPPKMCSRDEIAATVPPRLSSQLLRVCRQIYHEAVAILYSENTFKVNELHVLHGDFLCNIGVCNVARLNSVTIEVGDDDEGSGAEQDSLERVSLAAQDMLVTFQKHPALRSIQNFSVTIATSNRYAPLTFLSLDAPEDFVDIQASLQVLRRILALATLAHCGFSESHDLREQSVKTSAGWLESTLSLAKILPEHASERAKAVQKHFARIEVHCTGK